MFPIREIGETVEQSRMQINSLRFYLKISLMYLGSYKKERQ